MSASKLDAVYRSFLLTKFFTKGWGKPENLRRLFEFRKVVSNRDECYKLVERDYPVTLTKEQNLADCKLLEGYFVTPLERYLPGIVPEIAQKAHFQAILPLRWPDKAVKPVCLHLAGTGDHFFWRRRNLMVKPLIKEAGIGGIILENPFYGLRKPTDQIRSSLHNVSDIFVMGGCLILESLVLFHWCERNGLGPLGVTGLSMGGHMASLAATNWPKPLVLVPCLSWSTASAVFLQGVMSQSINWDLLEDQYLSDGVYRDKLSKMVTIVDEAFLAGKKFARTYSEYPHTIEKTKETIEKTKSEVIDNSPQIKKDNSKTIDKRIPQTKNSSSNKNVDITYSETNGASAETIVSELDINKVPKVGIKSELENIRVELKKLLDESKINLVLYEKLTSNSKFVLNAQDIDNINQLTEEKVKQVLLKYNFVQTRQQANELNTTTGKQHTEGNISKNESSDQDSINLKSKSRKNKSNSEDQVTKNTKVTKVTEDKHIVPVDNIKPKTWSLAEITSEWIDLGFLKSNDKKIDISKIHWRDREALQFMRGVMDECTHLSNFSVPYDTSLIIAVCAKHDAYVPREDVGTLEEIWPGAEVRYVEAGHVSAYILHQSLFRSCIKEAFERSKKRWKDGKHID